MNLKYFLLSLLCINTPIMTPTASLINKPAPVFTAQAVFPDGSEQIIDLKKYLGQKIVLYFYPMDNTPGCTCQAKNFKENIEKLKNHGIVLIGISCDSIKSHKKFQKKHGLPYILASDARNSQAISKMYCANSFFMSKRKTFLIDENGIIFKKFDKINIEKQVDEIIHEFEQYQY